MKQKSRRCCVCFFLCNAYAFLERMYSSMLFAPVLPAPIARMTVAEPVTASPPANTPSRAVRPPSSASMPPFLVTVRPLVVERISGLGLVPIAMMTVSTSRTQLEPSMGTGRRRPYSSGSPSSCLTSSMPLTWPFSSPMMATGLLSRLNSMPSASACSTSSFLAGSSSRPRR